MNSGSPDGVVNLEELYSNSNSNSQSPDSGVNLSSCSTVFTRSGPLIGEDDGQMVKLDLKRKTEKGEESNCENASRVCKFRRGIQSDSVNSMPVLDEEDKRKARQVRNRESAQLSRQRKKQYVEELEDKVRSMHAMISDLNDKVSSFMAENASLREQLSSGAVYPPPPMSSMPYPWYPYTYPMNRQGSQVPLVPIPKLKRQKPISAPLELANETDSKKGQSKTKKVASVSFLGLLFFLVLFGGIVPFVNNRYGERMEVGYGEFGSSFGYGGSVRWPQGRVLTVNGTYGGGERGYGKGTESEHSSMVNSDGFASAGNASEPLVASLYVPRNDKLVKIDGNLIINSVLASEQAMTRSRRSSETKNDKAPVSSSNKATGTGLVVAGNLRPSITVSNDRKSHSYGSDRTILNDGSLQKWFREGMEGPILSSGMCTEVFQFEISPTSSNSVAIVPVASSMHNASVNGTTSSADPSKRMNRRILDNLPIPLPGVDFNATGQHSGKASPNPNSNKNGTVSPPMVVSVMFDPREAGDGEE
ncbi:hypothetical protein Syun_002679 [Stephania yunnanensis]|uniref:BZIP domain-containing protein n=1 Tax=Stephania yunnanensis TaxID=152371 RepID=A0AAP0LLX7_9MAGN